MSGSCESKDTSAATAEVIGDEPERDGVGCIPSKKAHFGFVKRLWANPAQWLLVTGWIAMILFAFLALMHPTDAGDTWVAMACGRHFVNHGVSTVDPFSENSLEAGPTEQEVATWPDWARWVVDRRGIDTVRRWHPTGWINQNWLSHVLFYKLATIFGTEEAPNFNSLLYLKFTFYVLTVLCLYYIATILGAPRALAAWCTCFAMFVGLSFTGLRPADFSNLFAPTLLLILVLAIYRNILYSWLIVPLAILWGNLHGGYIYIFIMLIPFLGWHIIGLLPKRWGIWAYSVMGWLLSLAFTVRMGAGRDLCELVPGRCLVYVVIISTVGGLATVMAPKLTNRHLGILHAILSLLVFALALVRLYAGDLDPANIRSFISINGEQVMLIVAFIVFLLLGTALVAFRQHLVFLRPSAIWHVIAAYAVALVAVVVLNPFHLTNITHVYAISLSEAAPLWRDINEWRPAYEQNLPGNTRPFFWMLAIALAILALWILMQTIRSVLQKRNRMYRHPDFPHLPRLDISLLVIAGLTIVMAIRSRRFIAIAAFTTCPLLAAYTGQVFRVVLAWILIVKEQRSHTPVSGRFMTSILQRGVVAFVVCLGLGAAHSFGSYFLTTQPGPTESQSVFGRIVGVFTQPTQACTFLRENRIRGRLFNAWTQGGFIAWSQKPESISGRTPLQVIIDGRAQAAYGDTSYTDYWDIVSCAEPYSELGIDKREPNDSERQRIGQWVDERLQQRDVDVVLLPAHPGGTYRIVAGLESHANWRTVFRDGTHAVLVNTLTKQGRSVLQDMAAGRVTYEDEYVKHSSLACYLLKSGADANDVRSGLAHATEAFRMRPSLFSARLLTRVAAQHDELAPDVRRLCDEYLEHYRAREENPLEQNSLDEYYAAREMITFSGNSTVADKTTKL